MVVWEVWAGDADGPTKAANSEEANAEVAVCVWWFTDLLYKAGVPPNMDVLFSKAAKGDVTEVLLNPLAWDF